MIIFIYLAHVQCYLLHSVTVKSFIVWNQFYAYAASSSVVGDEYSVHLCFICEVILLYRVNC